MGRVSQAAAKGLVDPSYMQGALAMFEAPSWMSDEYTRLSLHGGDAGGLKEFARKLAEHGEVTLQLQEKMLALNRVASRLQEQMPITFSIVSSTGHFVELSRYSGRSCHNIEGMWQHDAATLQIGRERKGSKVASLLGVRPRSLALYIGAGCGELL